MLIKLYKAALWLLLLIMLPRAVKLTEDEFAAVKKFVQQYDEFIMPMEREFRISQWNYETSINDENRREMLLTQAGKADVKKEFRPQIMEIIGNYSMYFTKELKQYFKINSYIGSDILPLPNLVKYLYVVSNMTTNYFNETLNMPVFPTSLNETANVTDSEAKSLKKLWINWHNAVGRPNMKYYEKYLDYIRQISDLHDFQTTEHMWKKMYEYDPAKLYILWTKIMPLYEELHAYVRSKLMLKYPGEMKANESIPVHLLGTFRGDTWEELYSLTKPFPDNEEYSVTMALKELNFTKEMMFKEVQNFFNSFENYFKEIPDSFWTNSIFEHIKLAEENVTSYGFFCYPKAWDFFVDNDVRVKPCGDIDEKTLELAFKLGGQIQYITQYNNKIFTFRNEEQLGLLEAFGGFVRLAMSAPEYLSTAGILRNITHGKNYKSSIVNRLYRLALEILPSIPYNLIVDNVRHNGTQTFGRMPFKTLNCMYWKLREKWQGVRPPSIRRTPPDFDFATDYNVITGDTNRGFYKGSIIQFQILQNMFKMAQLNLDNNITIPEFIDFDLSGDQEVGYTISRVLAFGSSKEPPSVFEKLTGEMEMSVTPLLEYFETLLDWLRSDNKKNNVTVGWDISPIDYCVETDYFTSEEI